MEQTLFILVGVFAVGASALAMSRSVDPTTRVIANAAAIGLWAYWAFSAFDVTKTMACGDSPCAASFEYPGLVAFGAAFAVIMLAALVKNVADTNVDQPAEGELV